MKNLRDPGRLLSVRRKDKLKEGKEAMRENEVGII